MACKRGRPRNTSGTRKEQRRKARARVASAKYYKKNRKKILEKAKRKK